MVMSFRRAGFDVWRRPKARCELVEPRGRRERRRAVSGKRRTSVWHAPQRLKKILIAAAVAKKCSAHGNFLQSPCLNLE